MIKVLVAEDNKVNQIVVCKTLQKLGYKCTLATNGAEAVEAVQHEQFDVILMDIHMPVMDGLSATKGNLSSERSGCTAYCCRHRQCL